MSTENIGVDGDVYGSGAMENYAKSQKDSQPLIRALLGTNYATKPLS